MRVDECEINHIEMTARKHLASYLMDDLQYLDFLYNLLHQSYRGVNGTNYLKSTPLIRATLIIISRMGDYLRSIQILISTGYPEQAGTLAASLFELAHTCLYFTYSENSLTTWLQSRRIIDIREISKLTWRKMVQRNLDTNIIQGCDGNREYQNYQQLCWMKHSLPMRQGFIFKTVDSNNIVTFNMGPYTNEEGLQDARFVILQTGKYIELIIFILLKQLPNEDIKNKLNLSMQKREELDSKFAKLYGTTNPFEEFA